MKLIVGLVFCVALATGSVIDEFLSFKTRFNKVYKDEAEVRKEKIPIRKLCDYLNYYLNEVRSHILRPTTFCGMDLN